MDSKSLAKSKRAHTQHHKKHHPNQKVKGSTSFVGPPGTDKAPGKAVKEKPRQSQGSAALPSNWDRYEDEDDSMPENQTDGQPSDVVVRKSKGADYAYLISDAKSQSSTRSSSEIFPSLDDFVSDFGQGKEAFFAVRGESILSSIKNNSLFVEDKTPASYEASFLSLNLHALSEQLAKMDLPQRLFMEADFFPPEPPFGQYSEQEQEQEQERDNSSEQHVGANRKELQAYNHHGSTPHHTTKIQDHTSRTGSNPMVHPNPKSVAEPSENQLEFKAETAEAELDMLLDSFADAKLINEKASSKKKTVSIDIDGTLDDLLNETSTQNGALSSCSQPVSKSELLDDFDSWLDTI